MRGRDIAIILLCLAVAGGLIYAAGAQLDYIGAQRKEMGLIVNNPLDNAPPSLAFATVAMGAFRGLVVDILWMRADKLKEEGQFFDAKQLAEWITTLQPRFAAVWEFHAWNMAYNISVAIPATQPEQRWRWVRNGYELLRDKGIPLNPKAVPLYREFARILQHKVGGVSDDAHKYYKLRFAESVGPLLLSEDNGLYPEDEAFFDALVKAPETWGDLTIDPNFIEALQNADETFQDRGKFAQNYILLRQNPQQFKPEAIEVVDLYRGTETLKRFDIFAKAYEWRHTWKMDPALMREVNKSYGPIDFSDPNHHFPMDWRHPDCHAIYWAIKALKVAAQNEGREVGSAEVNTDRIVAHSLQNLFRYGKISIMQGQVDPALQEAQGPDAPPLIRRDIFLAPDLRIFASYRKALDEILDKYKDDRGRRDSMQNGHRNQLKNAVLLFYQAGFRREALKIYKDLRRLYPRPEFDVSLEQYAYNRIKDEMEGLGIHDAREQVVATLTRSYGLYAIHNDDEAAGQEEVAKQIMDIYNGENEPEYRIDLGELSQLRLIALKQFFTSGAYPLYVRKGLRDRMMIERPELWEELKEADAEMSRQMQILEERQ